MKKSDSEEVLWSKNFIIILAGSFLMFFAFFLLMPILPMFLKEQFDADKSTIGFALFVYSVMALIIRPFAGYMVDNFSRYKLLLFAYACFVVFFGLYLLIGSVFSFILVRAFHGLFYGLVTISNSTVAIDTMPASRRGEGIGFYGVMSSLAMAFGPTVSLSLYDFFHNYDAIFAIALLSGTLGFLCLFFLARALLTCRYFSKSWAGIACFAIREDEAAASSMGVSPIRGKLTAFVIGTVFAGLGGALYAHYVRFISPGDFNFPMSVTMMSVIVLGGIGTLWGPVIGAVILGVLPEIFRPLIDYRMLVYSILLLMMIRFQPEGILGENSFLMRIFKKTRGGAGNA